MTQKVRTVAGHRARNTSVPQAPTLAATAAPKWRTLEAVGVTEPEERLYEALLMRPESSLAQLAGITGLSQRKVQAVLGSLSSKGLATYAPERSPNHVATPPDIAMEALILRRQEALHQVRIAASALQEKANRARRLQGTDGQVIEILTGRAAQGRAFEQIQRAAKKEVICFDRQPYIWSPGAAINRVEHELLSRRIRVRGVYDSSSLELPGAIDRVRRFVASGEEARVFANVPLKLIGADHHMAMLPLDLNNPEGAALLVRSCSLLDALYELFEITWERAVPIRFSGSSGDIVIEERPATNIEESELQIALMAAGLNDKSIAIQLGISTRTLDRRMEVLLARLHARTRFQAGWQAALQSIGKKPIS